MSAICHASYTDLLAILLLQWATIYILVFLHLQMLDFLRKNSGQCLLHYQPNEEITCDELFKILRPRWSTTQTKWEKEMMVKLQESVQCIEGKSCLERHWFCRSLYQMQGRGLDFEMSCLVPWFNGVVEKLQSSHSYRIPLPGTSCKLSQETIHVYTSRTIYKGCTKFQVDRAGKSL